MNPSQNISIERQTFWIRMLGALVMLTLCVGLATTTFAQNNRQGAVFVGTNHNNTMDPSEPPNQVAMYRRAVDGRLTLLGYFNTGGQGSGPSKRFAGDGLGSAHSVQLSQDKRYLFVTNAGSNDVSVFRVRKNGLTLTDVRQTGDGSESLRFPNSVTQFGNLVYVLNSGDEGSITGFTFDSANGTLTPLRNSTRIINASPGNSPTNGFPPDTLYNPTQISFTPDGKKLVVTIKDGPTAEADAGRIPDFTEPTGPGRVLVFDVRRNGRPSADYVQNNLNNLGPFGFSFDNKGNLLIALFVGGDNLAAGAGSYRINRDGTLDTISEVKIDQLDTCWLENNGRFAFGANYSSGTISSFRIGDDGSLTIVDASAGKTNDLPGGNRAGQNRQGSTPLDIRLSPDGRFVYDVLPGSGRVGAWRILSDGRLRKIGEFGGLPRTINGDAAPEERFGPGGSPAGIEVL